MKTLLALRLEDEQTERVRLSHADAIRELQGLPVLGARVVTASLADGIATEVPHGLGRAPRFIAQSIVRGATSTGRIVETRSGSSDRSKVVVLTASGWGATIELEVVAW